MADIGNGTGLWPQRMRVRFSPCTPMMKIFLTECPKCHEAYQLSETHFYSFKPCISFQCPFCKFTYMLVINATECLGCCGIFCAKESRDIILETSGCMGEEVF